MTATQTLTEALTLPHHALPLQQDMKKEPTLMELRAERDRLISALYGVNKRIGIREAAAHERMERAARPEPTEPVQRLLALDDISPTPAVTLAPEVSAPVTVPAPVTLAEEVAPGGRPLAAVYSVQHWLTLLETPEGALDVSLALGVRPKTLSNNRNDVLRGLLPRSKRKDEFYARVRTGASVAELAAEFRVSLGWAHHYVNLYNALLIARKRKLALPAEAFSVLGK